MSRAVWFVAGASAGVYAMNKARQFAGTLSAEGMKARWQGVTHGARLVVADAKQAQATKEDELRVKLGLPAVSPDAGRQLGAGSSAAATATPALAPTVENDKKDTH
ncbi:DUF6167 family protein [Nocardioides yefusunii]|uniref:DUF6167 family protein n=1 Tax=Nocardioides yefusunii TaxID=2500546 RepID=A0ABW1R2F0_9ACTN|nr:DUF6167 family protein [Nocardioides yefusunii]